MKLENALKKLKLNKDKSLKCKSLDMYVQTPESIGFWLYEFAKKSKVNKIRELIDAKDWELE